MALATKCPHCNTIFRVAHDQLKLRGGIVRCGSCHEVFDGNAALVEPHSRPASSPAADYPAPPAAAAPAMPAPAPAEADHISFTEALAALDTRAAEMLTPTAEEAIYTLDLSGALADEEVSGARVWRHARRDGVAPAMPERLLDLPGGLTLEGEDRLELDLDVDGETPPARPAFASRPAPAPEPEPEPLPEAEPQPEPQPPAEPEPQSGMAQPAAQEAEPEPEGAIPDWLATALKAAEAAEPQLPLGEDIVTLSAAADGRREPTFEESTASAVLAPSLSSAHAQPALPLPAEEADEADNADPDEPGFVKRERRRHRLGKAARIGMALGSPLLVAALAYQCVATFRNQLAATLPASKPALQAICAQAGCKIELPTQIDELTIEQGELQTVAEKTFAFTTLLRNQGGSGQTWPHIELILNDGADKPVLRRVFAPREYLNNPAELERGFPPRSEQTVKLYFELAQIKASGYHIAVFYP